MMSFLFTALLINSMTAFFPEACDDSQCRIIERTLLDGGKLSALEIDINQDLKAYANPRVNLEGLELPLADFHYASGSRYSNYTALCKTLSNGELPIHKSQNQAENTTKYLLEGKDWTPERKDYDFQVRRAFFLAGEAHYKDEDEAFVIASFVKGMGDASKIIATVLCESLTR